MLARGGDVLARGGDVLARGDDVLARGDDVLARGDDPPEPPVRFAPWLRFRRIFTRPEGPGGPSRAA